MSDETPLPGIVYGLSLAVSGLASVSGGCVSDMSCASATCCSFSAPSPSPTELQAVEISIRNDNRMAERRFFILCSFLHI